MATWNTTANDITWTAVDDPSVTWTVQLNPNVTQSGGATALSGLSDVLITSAASGDILRHNGTNWVDAVGTTHFDAAGTASSAVSSHVAASDPHGDRAYAAGLVDDLSGVTNAATARTNLGLGTAAVAATGDFEPAGAVSTHSSDTTSVHGIADTSALETTTGAQAKVDAHVNDTSAAHAASAISVGTLNGNLSAVSGTDVEQALQAVDNLSLGGTVDVVSNVASSTILGRTTAGSGNSEELSASQVRTLLKTPQSSNDSVLDIQVLTQAAYNALGTPSSTTLYFIDG